MAQLTMSISGMSCGHCVNAVKQALSELDGVEVQRVEIGSASVSYDSARTTPAEMARAIEDAGYQVGPTQLGRAGPRGAADGRP